MATLSIIGECMIELNGSPFSHTLTQTYGGDTLNTAVYLARLAPKHCINYITAVGNDPISHTVVSKWQAEGINTQHVLNFTDKTMGLYWILLDPQGERRFMYWRKGSAASLWLQHPHSARVLNAVKHSDWLYLSGISLAILSSDDRQQLIGWLEDYRQKGGKIAFDSNYRALLWTDPKEMRAAYEQLATITDLALLTIEDEAELWNIAESEVLPHLMATNKATTIILKQGAKGAYVLTQGIQHFIPAQKVATVIDTTAAGDSFNAGVLAALLKGATIIDACGYGHKLASAVIQHKGAIIPQDKMPIL